MFGPRSRINNYITSDFGALDGAARPIELSIAKRNSTNSVAVQGATDVAAEIPSHLASPTYGAVFFHLYNKQLAVVKDLMPRRRRTHMDRLRWSHGVDCPLVITL
jgi:hypothetical protein